MSTKHNFDYSHTKFHVLTKLETYIIFYKILENNPVKLKITFFKKNL